MTHTLYNGSIADRVVQWFHQHPSEELTARDIAIKFGYRRNRVHERLAVAVREGYLEHSNTRPRVFRLKQGAYS